MSFTSKRILSALSVFSLTLSMTAANPLTVLAEEAGYGDIDGDPIVSEVQLSAEEVEESEAVEEADDTVSDNTPVTFIVELRDPCVIDAGLEPGTAEAQAYADRLYAKQESAVLEVEGAVTQSLKITDVAEKMAIGSRYVNVLNGFAVKAPRSAYKAIRSLPSVKNVFESVTYSVPELDPGYETEMKTSGAMIGINQAYSSGYQGEGMVVGILDTGLDTSHSAFSQAPANPKITNKTSFSGLNARSTYKSAKVPFAYDYADSDTNVIGSESHGTHVAGTIAGKNDVITGIAPEAQLAIFKVFSDSESGAADEWIISALEDVVIVKPDVINMSLGSPAGDAGDLESGSFNGSTLTMAQIYQRVYDAGVLLSVSAGNESYVGSANGYPDADNPNIGVVGSPSTYPASLSVASIENTNMITDYFVSDGITYSYSDSAESDTALFSTLASRTPLEYVDCGLGSAEECSAAGVSGKIALIQRGGLAFTEKQANAKNAGAVGAVIYNNVEGTINMSIDSSSIPCVSVTKADGQRLLASDSKVITLIGTDQSFENAEAYQMSDFSSWGTTDALAIKPEITAPGGHIYSSVIGGGYADYSGTSMAAPHSSGAMALVRQYAKSAGLASSGTALNRIVNQLIMSTAHPVPYPGTDLYYSPRNTGAGLVNINDAMAASAYLSVNGTEDSRPKIELGADRTKQGSYTLTFNVTNISSSAVTYSIQPVVQTEYVEDGLDTLSPYGLSCSVSGDSFVTVPAGQTKQVSVTVTLDAAARNYMDSNYPNGGFVEGFVLLNPAGGEDSTQLSLPFVGFYGDWDGMPLFDASVLNGSEAVVGVNGPVGYESLVEVDTDHGYYDAKLIGMNAYDPDYEYFSDVDPAYMTVSSTINSALSSYVSQQPYIGTYDRTKTTGLGFFSAAVKRNADWVRFRVYKAGTNQVYFSDTITDEVIYKNYEPEYYAYWNLLDIGWPGTDSSGKALAEGTECTLEVSMSADGGKNIQTLTFPIAIDNSKPYIVGTSQPSNTGITSITYSNAILATTASGRKYLKFKATDNYYLSAAQVSGTALKTTSDSDTGVRYSYLSNIKDTQAFYGTEKNAEYDVILDVTGITGSTYYVGLYDYTRWKTFYKMTVKTPVQESLKIDPSEITLKPGDTQAFAVTDESNYSVDPLELTWTVEGSESEETIIDEYGTLNIGKDETAAGLTVRAALADDEAVYAEAAITIDQPAETEGLSLYGRSLALDGTISVNYYFYVPEDELEDTNITLTFNDEPQTYAAVNTDTKVYDGKVYRKVYAKAHAKEMRDTILIEITDANGKPKEFEFRGKTWSSYEDSVAAYLSDAKATTNPKLVALAEAMDDYGKYAQIYFGYKTGLIEDAAGDVSYVSETDLAPYQASETGTVTGLTYVGTSLELNSDTSVRVYFQPQAGYTIDSFTFTVDGNTVTPEKSGSRYYIAVNNISAKELGKFYDFTAKSGTEEMTIRSSGLSYVYTALTKEGVKEDIKNVVRALYIYYQKTIAYFD